MGNRLQFSDIINIEKDKIGLCIATGPSLNPYLSLLKKLGASDKYCISSVNDFDTLFDIDAKYRTISNTVFTIFNEHRRFNGRPQTKLFYADSVDLITHSAADALLTIDYLSYDQRHFNGQRCEHCDRFGCKLNLDPTRLTIQEELQKYTKFKEHYSTGNTIALYMITFAILMGCNPIYVFGVDLNYKNGYANNPKLINHDSFNLYMDNIMNDLRIIRESGANIGVKLYSACENTPINAVIEYNPFKI